MEGSKLRALVVSLLCLTSPLFSALPASAGPRGHTLTTGEVEKKGVELVAGPSGVEYVLKGGARARLHAGSRFFFQPSMRLQLGSPTEGKTDTQVINLTSGRADVDVRPQSRTAVLVRGPRKLSSVTKGGTGVYVAGTEASVTASLDGDMLYGIGNKFRALPAEHKVTIAGAQTDAAPERVISAPKLVKGPRFVLAVHESAEATLSWEAVPNAESYLVSLVPSEGTPVRTLHSQAPGASLLDLPPGEYSVSARSVDPHGIESRPSPALRFRVVGIRLPEGARRASDDTVILHKNERVALVNAEGLELTYNRSTQFVRAPRSVGLSRNEPTVVRLRAPGSLEEQSFRLEPEGLRARVVLGPKLARWPADPVQLSVTLVDLHGRSVPGDTEVSVQVTVNLEPVPLEWHRAGNVLTATLKPRTGKGPWVVRAEVLDANDTPLGRGFLEVVHGDGTERKPGKKTPSSSVAAL